jgi:hypothetical protein
MALRNVVDNGAVLIYESCVELAIRDYKFLARNGFVCGTRITSKAHKLNKAGFAKGLIFFLENDMEDMLQVIGVSVSPEVIRQKIGMRDSAAGVL